MLALFLLVCVYCGVNSKISYRFSEVNCNGFVPQSAEAGNALWTPAFLELQAIGPERAVRSEPFFHHDLNNYHVVVWDLEKKVSRLILPLNSVYTDRYIPLTENFNLSSEFYNADEVATCRDLSDDCLNFMPGNGFLAGVTLYKNGRFDSLERNRTRVSLEANFQPDKIVDYQVVHCGPCVLRYPEAFAEVTWKYFDATMSLFSDGTFGYGAPTAGQETIRYTDVKTCEEPLSWPKSEGIPLECYDGPGDSAKRSETRRILKAIGADAPRGASGQQTMTHYFGKLPSVPQSGGTTQAQTTVTTQTTTTTTTTTTTAAAANDLAEEMVPLEFDELEWDETHTESCPADPAVYPFLPPENPWLEARNATSTHQTGLPARNSTGATTTITSTMTTTTNTIVSAKPEDYGTAEEYGTSTVVVAVIFALILIMLILGGALWYCYRKRRGPERLVGAFGAKEALSPPISPASSEDHLLQMDGVRGRVVYTID